MIAQEAILFGERLKELRDTRGLTVYNLSKQTGISVSSLSNYEACRNEPTIHNICTLANFFKCSTDYLLGEVDKSEMGPTAHKCAKKINAMKPVEQDWVFFLIDAIKDKADSLRKDERAQYNPDFLEKLADA